MVKLKAKALLISIVLLSFSFTSIFSATAAWYVTERQVSAQVSVIGIESGMTATLKYFAGNYSSAEGTYSGYENPGTVASSSSIAHVTDYSADFIVDDGSSDPFSYDSVFPDTRFTYAVEVNSQFAATTDIALQLTSFASPASDEFYNYDTGKAISLAEAINIYSYSFEYTDNADATSEADSFVTTADLTDHFTYVNSASAQPASYDLADCSITPEDSSGLHTKIILFTIEFSNQDDTFYTYYSTVSGGSGSTIYYFRKDPTNYNGGSSVYQSLGFDVVQLEVARRS